MSGRDATVDGQEVANINPNWELFLVLPTYLRQRTRDIDGLTVMVGEWARKFARVGSYVL